MRKNLILSLLALTLTTSCQYTARDPASDGGPSAQTSPGKTPSPSPTPKQTPSPTPKPSPTSPPSGTLAKPLWEGKTDGPSWTAYVMNKLDTLGVEMLSVTPADYSTFCPPYNKLTYTEKKEFWTYLISAISKKEDGTFNPSLTYKENFNDSNGNPVISTGLLQISIESANGYGCGFTSQDQLTDPYLNLACGIRILNRWVGRDLRIAGQVGGSWKGASRYWSTMRSSGSSYSAIVSLVKATPLCSMTAL